MYRSLTEGSAFRYSSSLIARIFEWYSSKDHNSDREEKVKSMKFRNSKELLCVGFEQRNSLRQYNRLLVLVRRSNSSTCRHDELLNHAPSLLQYPTKHPTTSAEVPIQHTLLYDNSNFRLVLPPTSTGGFINIQSCRSVVPVAKIKGL